MSRAFVKEDDGSQGEQLPDLPQSPHPNYVTASGLRKLQAALDQAADELAALRARKDEIDSQILLATTERRLHYLEERIKRAIRIDHADQTDDEIAFGALVTVADDQGQEHAYRIVGEDEADPEAGLISYVSPLAQALLGAGAGDLVIWKKPSGDVELEVLSFVYPAD
ncbi:MULTISPECIES: GreA/GreB family elongation factor [Limibacillus]|jgi:transcription elongation GreA/GreB family factor|uniref:Transcription elongation GreA/GreB family factor n=1 Tax=Limibacillus halophilus TaxID=1579333 RepID=A0A839SNV1_9PROT|nr:GreA/GreB family elongation factor [Limibacillus halophilus]MBB3064132.1 transcription elongation GreA/GreB family factor [Limibacillus halophilus]